MIETPRTVTEESAMSPRWPWWLVALYILFLVMSIFIVMAVALREDAVGERTLHVFTPLIETIVAWGKILTQNAGNRILLLGKLVFTGLGITAAWLLFRNKMEGVRPSLLLLGFACAILGKTFYYLKFVFWGHASFVTAAILFLLWRFLPQSLGPGWEWIDGSSRVRNEKTITNPLRFVLLEALGLVVLTSIVILYRFYALNQHPILFDGEIIAGTVVSTDLSSVFALDYKGLPSLGFAPLGLIYYFFCAISFFFWGESLLTVRAVSAICGIVLLPLIYGLLRRMGGVTAALIGTVLFVFSPLEMVWGRLDFFPLNYPTVITLSLAWVTYLALVKERFVYFLLCAFFMGLTYQVFPSGQTGFLVACFTIFFAMLLDWSFLRRCWWKFSAILLGIGFWLSCLTINQYMATGTWEWFSPLSEKAMTRGTLRNQVSWTSSTDASLTQRVLDIADKVWENFSTMLECFYVAIPGEWYFPRYSPVAGITEFPNTYLSALVAIFLFASLFFIVLSPRRKNSVFLLGWMAATVLTGILSSMAEARREATLFPALAAAASLGLIYLFNALESAWGEKTGKTLRWVCLSVGMVAIVILQGSFYFSQEMKTPGSVHMAQAVRSYLAPDTLVIGQFNIDNPYRINNELILQLLDDFSRPYKTPVLNTPDPAKWPGIAIQPLPDYNQWYYRFTRLKERVPVLEKKGDFKEVVFLIQQMPEFQTNLNLLKEIYPDTPVKLEVPFPEEPLHNFWVLRRPYDEYIKTLTLPSAEVVGDFQNKPQNSDRYWDGVRVQETAPVPPETPGATPYARLSAGMLIPTLNWVAFSIEGGNEQTELLIDNQPVPLGKMAPVSQGIHRVDIKLTGENTFPIRLKALPYRDVQEKIVTSDQLVSPVLCGVASWKPQEITVYEGFMPPQPVMTVENDFSQDFSVSPSGKIAMLKDDGEWLRVKIVDSTGTPLHEFEHKKNDPRMRRNQRIAFAGENNVVLLDPPFVSVYTPDGFLYKSVSLSLLVHESMDLAANPQEEIFVTSIQNNAVMTLRCDGQVLEPLTLMEGDVKKAWQPRLVSASLDGSVWVFDSEGSLHRFLPQDGSDKRAWSRVDTQSNLVQGLLNVEIATMAVSPENWAILNFRPVTGFSIMDTEGHRRAAESPDQDLSIRLPNLPIRLIGCDREGALYVFNETLRELQRLPRMGVDASQEEAES